MRTLTADQYKISADIAGNIATVWFAAGVVSPIFIGPKSVSQFIGPVSIGLIMSGFFTWIALILARRIKND